MGRIWHFKRRRGFDLQTAYDKVGLLAPALAQRSRVPIVGLLVEP